MTGIVTSTPGATLAPIATAVVISVEFNPKKNRSVLVASAGPLRASTRPFGGRYSQEQAQRVWRRQPGLFVGDTEVLRRFPGQEVL